MDDLAHQEIDLLLEDPNYNQGMLQDWFKHRYRDQWQMLWNHYLETGRIGVWSR